MTPSAEYSAADTKGDPIDLYLDTLLYQELCTALKEGELQLLLKEQKDQWENVRGRKGRPPTFPYELLPALICNKYLQESGQASPGSWRDAPHFEGKSRITRQNAGLKWLQLEHWQHMWQVIGPVVLPWIKAKALEQRHVVLGPDWNTQIQQLIRTTLDEVLGDPMSDHLPRVLQIPPGLGKTSGMVEELCTRQLLLGGAIPPHRKLRVLWFARETKERDAKDSEGLKSLAEEVVEAFRQADSLANVQIIRGGQKPKTQMKYLEGRWFKPSKDNLQVRILAHAYLPLFFGEHHRETGPQQWMERIKEGADLVIIDEDPLQSLILTESAENNPFPLRWSELLEMMVSVGLLPVQHGLQDPVPPVRKRGRAHSPQELDRPDSLPLVPGNFRTAPDEDHRHWLQTWAAAITAPSDTDGWLKLRESLLKWAGFKVPRGHLSAQKSLVGAMVCCLKDELIKIKSGEAPTRHFGLIWKPGSGKTPSTDQAYIRFSLRTPLKFRSGSSSESPLPVIVLDAYAHAGRYGRMLGAHTVAAQAGDHFRLEINYVLAAGALNPSTVEQGDAQRHLIHQLFNGLHACLNDSGHCLQPVVFLMPKAILPEELHTSLPPASEERDTVVNSSVTGRTFIKWMHQVAPGTGTPESLSESGGYRPVRLHFQHWYAGRGRNAYSGMDVVALTRPVSPDLTEERLMAFYPENTSEGAAFRHSLRKFDDDAELLQMLHRGRQLLAKGRQLSSPPVLDDLSALPKAVALFDLSGGLHPLLQNSVIHQPYSISPYISSKLDVPIARSPSVHRWLPTLPVQPKRSKKRPGGHGKLELTKMMAAAIVLEFIHARPVGGMPSGWLPQLLLTHLGLTSGELSDNETQLILRFLLAYELDDQHSRIVPAFRYTLMALRREGPWSELMPLGRRRYKQKWVTPGGTESVVPYLCDISREHLGGTLVHEKIERVDVLRFMGKVRYDSVHFWLKSVQRDLRSAK